MDAETRCHHVHPRIRRPGRVVPDGAIDLPEGTVLGDERNALDAAERAALEQTLQAAHRDTLDGRIRPASEILRELHTRR